MRILTMLVIAVVTGSFGLNAHAAPIVLTVACINNPAAQCATGINDLSVGSSVYNVSFSQASYDDVFASSLPQFFGNSGGRLSALSAMEVALNGAAITGVIGMPTVSFVPSSIVVPTVVAGSGGTLPVLGYFPTGSFFLTSGSDVIPSATPLSDFNPQTYNAYAVFTPANTVPAPGILGLFVLAVLILVQRRYSR